MEIKIGLAKTAKYANEYCGDSCDLAERPHGGISAIIADEAAIGMVNSKTTAVRIIPAPGKTVGGRVEMGGLLGSSPVMPVHDKSSENFIARGGRIPAPLQSLKN